MTVQFTRPAIHPADPAERISNFLLIPFRATFGSRVSLNRDLRPVYQIISSVANHFFKLGCFLLALPITGLMTLAGIVLTVCSRSYLRSAAHFQLEELGDEGIKTLKSLARQNPNPFLRQMASDLDLLSQIESSDFSVQETEAVRRRTSVYKPFLSDKKFAPLYALFKRELGVLMRAKIPFRIVEETKDRFRAIERGNEDAYTHRESHEFIEKLENYICNESQPERKQISYSDAKRTLIPEVRAKVLKEIEVYPSLETKAKILEKIQWVHGTSSAILPFLSASDCEILPTGKLFARKIAPMSGELGKSHSGMFAHGILYTGTNNQHISGETLRGLGRAWWYASNPIYRFDPGSLQREKIENLIKKTDWRSIHEWNAFNLLILRLRQWDEPLFQMLANETSLIQDAMKQIEEKKNSILHRFNTLVELTQEIAPDDGSIQSQDLPHDDIKYLIEQALNDKESYDILLTGLQRCKSHSPQIFNEKKVDWAERFKSEMEKAGHFWKRIQEAVINGPALFLGEQEKDLISQPFPILIASSTVVPRTTGSKDEYQSDSVRLGIEGDLLFTDDAHLDKLKESVQKLGLADRVAVYSSRVFENFPMPLIHDSRKVEVV